MQSASNNGHRGPSASRPFAPSQASQGEDTWEDAGLYREEALEWYRNQGSETFVFRPVPPRLGALATIAAAAVAGVLVLLFAVPVPHVVQFPATGRCASAGPSETTNFDLQVPAAEARQLQGAAALEFLPGSPPTRGGVGPEPSHPWSARAFRVETTLQAPTGLWRVHITSPGCDLPPDGAAHAGTLRATLPQRPLLSTSVRRTAH